MGPYCLGKVQGTQRNFVELKFLVQNDEETEVSPESGRVSFLTRLFSCQFFDRGSQFSNPVVKELCGNLYTSEMPLLYFKLSAKTFVVP